MSDPAPFQFHRSDDIAKLHVSTSGCITPSGLLLESSDVERGGVFAYSGGGCACFPPTPNEVVDRVMPHDTYNRFLLTREANAPSTDGAHS